jgi:hypothetical protein
MALRIYGPCLRSGLGALLMEWLVQARDPGSGVDVRAPVRWNRHMQRTLCVVADETLRPAPARGDSVEPLRAATVVCQAPGMEEKWVTWLL